MRTPPLSRRTRAALLAFVAALASGALAPSPAAAWPETALPPAQQAAIDAAVRKTLAATGIPSAELAVVKDGRLVLARAWGKASETIPAATPELPYQIASNSKQFLAALILMLRDEGKLGLDDPVAKYVPGITGGARITIRELLAHTSGLQDYWPQDYVIPPMTAPVAPAGIVERWAKKPLDYPPGTRWQYSNTGYVVAGLVAEKAGGAPLWSQFQARIFGPLGMTVVPLDATAGPGFPQGYHRNALGPVVAATPAAKGWLWAAGELAMTAADLAKWDIARITRALLPARDWDEQETPFVLADGTTAAYGLGVGVATVASRRRVTHSGESVGFVSRNTVYPDSRAAIVVLTNGDFADAATTIGDAVAEIVLPRDLPADSGEPARTDDARAEYLALARGAFASERFTANDRFYFDARARADYAASLGPLGAPSAFAPAGPPRLRGGFVNRNFTVTAGGRKLAVITYAEPGAHGRWEQFLVGPAE